MTAYGVPVREITTAWDGGIAFESWEVGDVLVEVSRRRHDYASRVVEPFPYTEVFHCKPRENLHDARDAAFRVAALFTTNENLHEHRKICELVRELAR